MSNKQIKELITLDISLYPQSEIITIDSDHSIQKGEHRYETPYP